MKTRQERAEEIRQFVEAETKQSVRLYSEYGGWYAFINEKGGICVVCDNILSGKIEFSKPSRNMMFNLNIVRNRKKVPNT